MQIDIIPFNESLTEFGFKPSEINAINLRIHTHIIPQLESIQVEAKVSDDFGEPIILKMNGDEIELLIYLLETFGKGSQKQILLNKLLKIKLEMITKVSQNSR